MENKENKEIVNPFPWTMVGDGENVRITIIMPDGSPKEVCKKTDRQIFSNLLLAIKEERWEDVPNIIDPEKLINEFADGRFVVKNNLVFVNGETESLPNALSYKIIDFAKNDLPCEPLLKFWKNLKENPSNRSINHLFEFLEKFNHPITSDGCFIAYKGVNDDENLTDRYTGKFSNKPGTVNSMPRSKVDDNPNNTCSHGWHVASYDYANSWADLTVSVKVNPKDVVSVPIDHGGQKMRVAEYEVLAIIQRPATNTTLVNSVDDYYHEDDSDEDDFDEEYDEDYNWGDEDVDHEFED